MHITVAVGGHFERSLTHWSCYWGPLQKQGIYTLKLLLGASFKERYLHITIGVRGPCKSKVLTHYSCFWGPFENRVLTH